MKILSLAEIAQTENAATSILYLPEIILMENAASSICTEVEKLIDKESPSAILCGFGNNGGDGFATARKLFAKGFNITIFYSENISKFSPSAKLNFDILKNMGGNLIPIDENTSLDKFQLIIDAIFGIGLKRTIEDKEGYYFESLIKKANESKAFKIAVDVPSGLFSDECEINGTVFKADITITFTALKICQSLYPSKEYCGKIILSNISIPENFIKGVYRELVTENELPRLTERKNDSNKGSYGKTFILGGSFNMTGAPSLAAIAALKIGSGLTYLGLGTGNNTEFISNYPEIILKPWNMNEPNMVIDFINSKMTSLLIGPGMGTEKNTVKYIKQVVSNVTIPIIIDADGINCLNLTDFNQIKGPTVITPHLKEFAVLLETSIDNIKKDRLNLAQNFALTNKTVLVLKSADTIIATPDGSLFVMDFGTPAMAKGGSGDALGGTIAGLISQGYSMVDAAKLAVFINGRAALYAAKNTHVMTVTAMDMIHNFWRGLNDIGI